MNRKLRTDTLIKLFNQSIGRLRLTKTKSLILASLLVGAMVTLLSAPLQAAGPSTPDRGRATCPHLLHPAGGALQTSSAWPQSWTVHSETSVMARTAKQRFSASAGFRRKIVNMAIASTKRRSRSAPFTCSSLAVWLPTTSRGAQYRWFSRKSILNLSRRAGWDVPDRNRRTRHYGSDWEVSVICRWS